MMGNDSSAAKRVLAFPAPNSNALILVDQHSRNLLRQMECVAPSMASVLIQGETGTGKERIARQLHALSGRKGPFIAVNCGALAESLIEAELFGHEAGAFTGAHSARAGWFEAANGGTLFLDEVGELPLGLQVKLLRVLQEHEVVRLGARRSIALDVRLLTATNVDLVQAVEAGRFRMDLYYRMNVATLRIPPLRERLDDLQPLAQHFIRLYCQRMGIAEAELSHAALQALQSYAWPGNIRELENVLQYALLVCREQHIRPEDLRFASVRLTGLGRALTTGIEDAEQALERAFDQLFNLPNEHLWQTVEGRLLQQALRRCEGNQVRTAQRLGISRNVLRTLLKHHGLLSS